MTLERGRRIYCGSLRRSGSLGMPLCLSVLTQQLITDTVGFGLALSSIGGLPSSGRERASVGRRLF